VAPDQQTLRTLRAHVVAADWELCAGATESRAALDQVESERPHALVVWGWFHEVVLRVAGRFPGMQIVSDRPVAGVDVTMVGEMSAVRAALRAQPRPGGPII
jgi:hypothetical protein